MTRSGRLDLARLAVAAAVALGLVACDLDLYVPLLLEAAQGEGDQQELDRDEDDRQEAEDGRLERGVVEARLVTLEPGGTGHGRDDGEEDGERGGHGENAAVPAGNEKRHADIDD